MPSSKPDKKRTGKRRSDTEPHDISQLGLDFMPPSEYSVPPRKEIELMDQELLAVLEKKVNDVVEKYDALKAENARLNEEIHRFSSEKEGLKSRVDAILGKLEGI